MRPVPRQPAWRRRGACCLGGMRLQMTCKILFGIAVWVLPVAGTYGGPHIVALDNISTNSVTRFDRAGAVIDERLRITSVEDNAVIPKNHLYPIVEWESPEDYSTAFLVELRSSKRTLEILLRKGLRWQPEGEQFAGFLNDREVVVTVYRLSHGKTSKSRSVRLVVSERAVTDRIVFRAVPLYFIPGEPVAVKLLFLHQRQAELLLHVQGACVGCHAYADGTAIFNSAKKKTRMAVTVHREDRVYRLNRHLFKEFSFVALSPDGKHAAVVKQTTGKLVTRKDSGDPFDLVYKTGDIYIYSFATDTVAALPGASDPQFVEDMPWFSPDGTKILFSRYKTVEKKKNKVYVVESMDFYEVPFNGGKGGTPVPIPGASANGMYQYFARYTPNGKWISFCRANASKGAFVRKDSDIHLLSLNDHAVTKLSLNKDTVMDSWHDWSSDSHWLIFSSRRDKNQLTALYMSYVDDNGKDHPPIKIADEPERKTNTPLFAPATLNLETAGNITDYVYGCFP